jgi:threonine/homoserine/homoserine lactone efflux protein
MSLESAVAFAAIVFVFAATPGPAILACIAQALGSGFRSALALVAGIVLGDVLFLLVAVYGLAMMASVLEGFFVVIRIGGAAYLAWIGWRMWRSAPALPRSSVKSREHRHTFRAGLLLTLGNPKVILFYLGFLPAFIGLSDLRGGDVAAVMVLLVCVLTTVNASYAWMAATARGWVEGPAAVRRLNRGAGALLMAAGIYVAIKR